MKNNSYKISALISPILLSLAMLSLTMLGLTTSWAVTAQSSTTTDVMPLVPAQTVTTATKMAPASPPEGAGSFAPVDVINPELYVDPPTAGSGAHYVFLFQITTLLPWPGQVYIDWGWPTEFNVPDLTYPAGDPRLEQMLISWDPVREKLIDENDLTKVPVTPTVASAPPYESMSWHSIPWVPDGQVWVGIPLGPPLPSSGDWMRVDFWGPPTVSPGKEDAGITNPDTPGNYCLGVATSAETEFVEVCVDITSPPVITATKTAPASAYPGEVITYDIVIQNIGDETGAVEFMEDYVPEGAAYAGHEPPLIYSPGVEGGFDGVFWEGGLLGPGETITLTWGVTVTGGISDTILNKAVIYGAYETLTATAETHITAAPAHLVATISAPAEGDTFSTEQEFVVTATISNTGEADALNVSVTIEVIGGAELSEGETATREIGLIAGGDSAEMSWTLVCTGARDVTITVTPAGTDENTGEAIPEANLVSDSVTVEQELKAHLVADITAPAEGETFSTEQEFVVAAAVCNGGEADALDVTATLRGPWIGIPEFFTKFIGDIPGGECAEVVTWTVVCISSGPVTITVTPAGTDENTGKAIPEANLEADSLTVEQELKAHLVVDISAPAEVSTEQEFEVTATVENTGEADALGVSATIEVIGGAELADGETATKEIGLIAGGGSAEASWTLVCTSSEAVLIIVTPAGTDENTGEAIPEANLEPDSVTVNQEEKAHLVATISAPADGATVSVGQQFTVTATISNIGEANALTTTATMEIVGGAKLAEGETLTKTIGAIAAGDSAEVSRTLVCVGTGDVTITVTPAGTDENTGEAIPDDNLEPGEVTVHQRCIVWKYNLPPEPEIKPPTCCCVEGCPHLQGINIVEADVCAKCCTVGDYPGLLQDACTPSGLGAGVYLHSGEFYLCEVDLEIPGRGFNWTFERKYRSGVTYDGPLGHNWQFNYNQYLVEVTEDNLLDVYPGFGEIAPGDVLRVDGYGRVDIYAQKGDGSYQAPTGFYTRLTQREDGSFEERDYRGVTVEYGLPDEQSVARMIALTDRYSNTMRFEHDDEGRLEHVLDTLGRPITYTHDAQGRLSNVEDFIGRVITLTYDADGNLVEVTSPAVTGTPNGNDFPQGKTTLYTYSSGSADPVLNHNLTAITAPKEVATAGPPRIQVGYDGQDRVVIFTIGGTNDSGVPAGGTISYTYTTLAPPMAASLNTPVGETEVVDRNGNHTVYQFNSLGNIVKVKEYTNRDVRPSEPEFYETRYEYNAEGELIRQTYPEGNLVEYVYDEANPNRFQQGNLIAEVRRADPDRGGDQAVITTTYTYELIYNHVRTETEARGNDPNYVPQNGGAWSPERYTTIHTFDYEEGCDFAAIGTRIGLTATEVQQLLADAGMCLAPLGDVNGDGITDQINGGIIRTVQPTVTLLSGSNQALVEGDMAQEIVELYTYNQFGQMLTMQDAEGNVDVHEYYPERDPNGDGVTDNPAGDPSTGGYLKQVTLDAVSDPARDSGTNPPPTNIRRVYEYDPVGNVIREVDGRGIATDYVVNTLNQVVQTVRAAAHNVFTPDPAEPLPLTDFQYLERIFYDANDNVVRRQVEDRGDTSNVSGDNAGSGTAFVDYVHAYDILDNQIQMTEEVSDTLDLVTRYRYDPNGNQVLVIQPEGNGTASVYDERDLLFQSTRGATLPPPLVLLAAGDPTDYDVRGGLPSTMTYHYDGNRNLIETVDAADTDGSPDNDSNQGGFGDRTRYLYDGFDRRTSLVDSVGNQTVTQYDPAGNVVRVSRFGPVGGASPTSDGPDVLPMPVSSGGVIQAANLVNSNLLEATESLYDELTRVFQTDRALFVNTIPTVRPPDVADGASDIGKGDLSPADTCAVPVVPDPPSGYLGCVSTRTEYDRNSRRTFTVEDDGDTYRTFYDGAGRVIKTLDPEGNTVETAYDDNDNLIEVRETDVSQVTGVPDEVFLTTNFYDSLNRLQRSVDNLGQTFDYRYDSRDNLVARADAQGPLTGDSIARRAFSGGALTVNDINDFGNVTLYFYDGINRQTRQEVILTASGEGDGVHIGATLEGIKTTTPTPDPTQGGGDGLITIRYEWDDNSLLTSLTDDNGNQTQYTYDNFNRWLTETKGICVPPALADRCDPPTTITYEYDLDDNLVRLTDENGSVTNCQFDAINRRAACAITRAPGVVGTTAVTYEYDGLSRMTRATDNNDPGNADDDSTITYAYDSLSRVIEETQRIGSLSARATSATWRAENLRARLTYPNGREIAFTFDGLDRIETIGDKVYTVYLPIVQKRAGAASSQLPAGPIAANVASRPANSATSMSAAGSIAEYTYVGSWRVLERTYANGVRLTYLDDAGTADVGYDGLRRPVQLRHLRADNSLVVGFNHTYDRMNNKLAEVKLHDPANDEEYGYDSAYRLIDFDRPDVGAIAIAPLHSDWTLDGVGNWQQVDSETREHSSFNEIIERSDGATTTILSDDNGNETDDGDYIFEWDYRNCLRTVTRKSDSALIAVYTYDAENRRTRKVVTNSGAQNGTTDFYYDGWQVVEERDGDDALVQQYVYSVYIDEPLVLDRDEDADDDAIGAGDTRLFYHQNTLYSVFALTDAADILEGYLHDAYGRQTVFEPGPNGIVDFGGNDVVTPGDVSALDNPFMFTGRRLDGETGLYYYRTRYLNTEQGRFISRDMAGVWGDETNLGNGHAYVGNNPTNASDALGLTALYQRVGCLGSLTKAWIQGKATCTSSDGCHCDGRNQPTNTDQADVILYEATTSVQAGYPKIIKVRNDACRPDCKMECNEIMFAWKIKVGAPTPWGVVGRTICGGTHTVGECADGSTYGEAEYTCD